MFDSASNLLQGPAYLVQCLGSKEHLTKSKSNPNQLHHIKLNKNGSFACHTNCIKFKSYRICNHTIAVAEKEKYLEKLWGFVWSNEAKFSDLSMQIYSRTMENSVKKATQGRKGTKQVKENPAMYCSSSNTN